MFKLDGLFERHYGARQLRPGNSSALRNKMSEQLKQLKTDNFRIQVSVLSDNSEPKEQKKSQSWALR